MSFPEAFRMGVGQGVWERNSRRDVVAFFFLTAFVVEMYTVPGEQWAWVNALRLAFVTSTLAASLMLLRRLGRMEPFSFDGARGTALAAFVLLSALSISWSVNPEVSRFQAGELVKVFAIYLTIVNVVSTPRRLFVICGALCLATIVTSIGAINWYNTGIDLVEGFRARWIGVYADPNHMAMDLGIAVPLCVAIIARKQTSWALRALFAVAAALATIGIVISHSRGGFIGLIASLGVWLFFEKQYRVQAIAVAAVLAVGLAIFAPKSFWTRTETVTTVDGVHEDASAMGRVYAWHVASEINKDKPLLGVGAAGFRYAWPLYAPAESHKAYVAHNIYLDVIGELGIIGFILFLFFTGGAAGGAFEATRDPDVGWLARALGGAVIGYLFCDCFSGYLLSSHFYVLFGLAAASHRISRMRVPELVLEKSAPPSNPVAVPVPALPEGS